MRRHIHGECGGGRERVKVGSEEGGEVKGDSSDHISEGCERKCEVGEAATGRWAPATTSMHRSHR